MSLITEQYRDSATSFFSGLNPFFQEIQNLRNYAVSLIQNPTHDRIRIAVLDSGVDDMDSKIRYAMRFGRINTQKSKSFVGKPNEWQQDTYGHGTHVTQLLLKTAPAAEIYVGKICTTKVLSDDLIPGIERVRSSFILKTPRMC